MTERSCETNDIEEEEEEEEKEEKEEEDEWRIYRE